MHPGPREKTFRLSDGRTMAYAEYGDPDGAVVLGCHGSPSSRLERHVEDAEDYRRWGVRLVVPDRPGFGRSDPHPGRRVADWPGDASRSCSTPSASTVSGPSASRAGPPTRWPVRTSSGTG
jgi:pimeloyl-ACP methyl ester carboxylesterase